MSFWTQVEIASELGGYYSYILLVEVVLALVLAAARPAVRLRLRAAIIFLLASFCLTAVSASTVDLLPGLAATGLPGLLSFLAQALFTTSTIQILAILLFRVALPPIGLAPAPILRDTLLGVAYIAAFLFLLGRHGVNLSGIVATSAVLTGVIGFSLQDTLGNVMGGASLQLERIIGVGDYIRIGDIEGVVRETRWRQTSIETVNADTVLIPNSMMTKSVVTILGRTVAGSRLHRAAVRFSINLDTPPATVIAFANRAFHGHSLENVATNPNPNCVLSTIQQNIGSYSLHYWIVDMMKFSGTNSLVQRRLVAALQREGIRPAATSQDVTITSADTRESSTLAPKELNERIKAVATVTMFEALNDEERREVAACLTKAPFSDGDVINYQGEAADYLYILAKGTAAVSVTDSAGGSKHVATLKAGDVFGEMGMMTGQPRSATVTATSEMTCFRLNRDDFKQTIERRGEIAEAISLLLAKRRVELEGVAGGGDIDSRVKQTQNELLGRIRSFFLLR